MYPTVTDYRAIISSKLSSFVLDNVLKKGNVEMQKHNPLFAKMFTGGFACVFKIKAANKQYALRCWTGNPNNIEKRYYEISKYLENKNLPYFVNFKYTQEGILVNSKKYPITRMDWIEGYNLKDSIFKNINNPNELHIIAEKFRVMVKVLHENNISHGDLQSENILFDKDQNIKLIDYDSLYVPNLSNEKDYIKGIQGFQHPNRKSNHKLNPKSDHFSELVIYLSILALSVEPKLWDKHNIGGTETLLFTPSDFENFQKSDIYNDLVSISPFIWYLTERLYDSLQHKSLDNLIPLEKIITEFTFYSPASPIELSQNYIKQEQRIKKLQSSFNTTTKYLNTERSKIKKLEIELKNKKKGFSGFAIAFPWFVAVILGIFILSYISQYNQYQKEASKVDVLEKGILNLETNLDKSNEEINSLQNTVSNYKSKIDNIVFNTGFDYRKSNSNSFDKSWRLFFTTYESIILKNINVCAKENGNIKILLYDINENLISKSNEFTLNRGNNEWYKLAVNIPIEQGSYFLAFEGNTSLKYDSKEIQYPYLINNIVKITGSDNKLDKNKTSYYQYFYNWELSIKID